MQRTEPPHPLPHIYEMSPFTDEVSFSRIRHHVNRHIVANTCAIERDGLFQRHTHIVLAMKNQDWGLHITHVP